MNYQGLKENGVWEDFESDTTPTAEDTGYLEVRVYEDESEQEKLQRHGENDEPEQVDNGQQHYEDMQSQYE